MQQACILILSSSGCRSRHPFGVRPKAIKKSIHMSSFTPGLLNEHSLHRVVLNEGRGFLRGDLLELHGVLRTSQNRVHAEDERWESDTIGPCVRASRNKCMSARTFPGNRGTERVQQRMSCHALVLTRQKQCTPSIEDESDQKYGHYDFDIISPLTTQKRCSPWH
ncbi:hypothetical protein K466DRAFT_213183 [Polyporus arcularius HHB13444]|uniref:Uncharacterized protein n=1 Tax=Polyporus arcularius HHB13444 TaxID=1314778 RepID=A0A5C3P8A4_9APHY|nr:hypothetical protein K466DRAFT_213183 [Polyporus arcularius HHB13444]